MGEGGGAGGTGEGEVGDVDGLFVLEDCHSQGAVGVPGVFGYGPDGDGGGGEAEGALVALPLGAGAAELEYRPIVVGGQVLSFVFGTEPNRVPGRITFAGQ